MKINSVQNPNIDNHSRCEAKKQPAFKSAMTPVLSASGGIMQSIENGGFLVSFIIQDFLGMTIPRTIVGFRRDKDKTGHYNKQEGFEVLGREGLTGPCMMAVAPLCLLVAAKCAGKSTSVNTELIKKFGNSLKEVLAKPEFDKNLLKAPEKFKQEFYKTNIEKILIDTVGKENATKESVEYIMKQLQNMEKIPADVKLKRFRGKSKYKSECMDNIVNYINEIKLKTSSDLDMLCKVKFGSDKLNDKKTFATKDAFDAMIKYTDDAIVANKNIDKLNELEAEKFKNKSLAKRIITNVSMIFTTLGVLSVLPKIYARSNVAPGARNNVQNNAEQKEQSNVSFKGKGKSSLLEKLGKLIGKNKSDFVSSELEYNGHNFTNTLMAGLSIFGLLVPRGLRAYNRAQTDETTGKKDLTELWEILIRDVTSSLAVVFAVPMGTRAAVTTYENKSGFVLMQKNRDMSKKKTILDLLNPYSKAHVMTNAEITALYDNINSKAKMLNFCKYIDKNGGDLQKIISKSENASSVFNKSTMELSSLKGLKKADKNKKIIEFFEKFDKPDSVIKNLMKGAGAGKKNKILAFARGLNSVPGLLTTIFISPYLLGCFIPKLTYKNTRRIHEKQDREREALNQQKLKTTA